MIKKVNDDGSSIRGYQSEYSEGSIQVLNRLDRSDMIIDS
jgi:hypothetical protein